MRRWTWAVAVAVLGSATAGAQEQRPTVAPFPLDVKRAPQHVDGKVLQAEYKRLLRNAGATVPDAATLEDALAELKRQDCDRDNDCLKQLAQKGKTLYAVYASVDLDVTQTKVTATGRVVRDDGKLMGEPGAQLVSVTVPIGSDTYADAVRVALTRLFETLGVKKLPAVRPAEGAVVTPPGNGVKPPNGDGVVPPPPVTPSTGAMRKAGWAVAGTGAAALVVGGVFGVMGLTEKGKVSSSGPANLAEAQARQRADGNFTVGAIATGVGVVAAAAGVVMVLLDPPEEKKGEAPTVGVAPVPGGGVVVVGGRLPW